MFPGEVKKSLFQKDQAKIQNIYLEKIGDPLFKNSCGGGNVTVEVVSLVFISLSHISSCFALSQRKSFSNG